jgi:putative hemolysin
MALVDSPVLKRSPQPETQRLVVSLARSLEDVKQAQLLRHNVFVEQLGARLGEQRGRLERDRFDPFCLHFIVRDTLTQRVVGTYRMLTPERARVLGSFMAAREFDLARFDAVRADLAEVGRACVHADYRRGATIMLLWSALAGYARRRGIRFLFGCVTLGLEGDDVDAYAIYDAVAPRHLAPREFRVVPLVSVPRRDNPTDAPLRLPALLKGYLRAGGWVCGEPAWDPEFETAELLVLLPLDHVEERYARHFLRPEN